MTPQELKTSLLKLAFEGRLVEQRHEEGTAQELFRKISLEKSQTKAKGNVKRCDPVEEEIPFEIPETWCWVHINEIAVTSLGKTLDKIKNTGTLRPYLCSINVYWNRIDLKTVKEARFEEAETEKYLLRKGDLLICEGGDAGRSTVWNLDTPMWYQNALHRVRFLDDINPYFYKYLLEYYRGMGIIERYSKGVTIKHLVQNSLYAMWLPFPPIAEQKRIVAKIEELLPYIDRYEQAWSKLEDFNKRFPVDMQKSILQMAIQGKLVEQRPEEGTGEELYQQIQQEKQKLTKAGKIKKEKLLPEISEDEKPFEIPESWKWCRLNEVSRMIGDIDHKMPAQVESNGIPYVSPLNFTKDGGIDYQGAKQISKEDYEILGKKCKPNKYDIIFPRYGTIGVVRLVETDQPFIVSYSCCTIKNMDSAFMDYKYVLYVLKSGMIQREINRYINKTTQPNVGLQSIKQFLFPLPPLDEQKRIVAKLEEILPLCERLK